MRKYFKIKRDTLIGKELTKTLSIIPKIQEEAGKLCDEYKFKEYRRGHWTYAGGFTAFCSPLGEVDLELFKQDNCGNFTPRLNTRKGKELQAKMDSVPSITTMDINKLFGLRAYEGMGIAFKDKEWIGISVEDNAIIPPYAIEITKIEWMNL